MAKKALVNKANKKPKFAVRAYTRCQRCGRPHSVFRKFGLCRICSVRWRTPASCPAFTRAPGEPVTRRRNGDGVTPTDFRFVTSDRET